MGLRASHCRVSEMSKENTENSPDIFVVERNWQEVSTKPLLLEIKQVWQNEMHLAVSDHMIVEQDKNMGFSIVEEKNEHESFAIKSNLEEFTVMLDLVKQNMDVASVRQHVKEKQSTQKQAIKLAVNTLTREEGRKCSQMNKMVEFVKECQVELHEYSRGEAMYRRHSSDLSERNQPYKDNASDGTKAVKMSFWRKHDVELKKLLDKFIPNGSENCNNWLMAMETLEWMQWHKLTLMRIPN